MSGGYYSGPNVPNPNPAPAAAVEKPRRKGRGWRIFFGILFVMSVLTNFVLLLMVMGMAVLVAGGGGQMYEESVIQEGPWDKKIAVVNINGVIDGELENYVRNQIDSAWNDDSVRGVLVRISSPGGGVAASDNIHHYIKKYRQESGRVVYCYMDGLAASGGYYSAVACEKIFASPTTITGSIGVIMGHFVLQDLLEEKLGISPVVLKSGRKKDWPSMFRETTPEEKQYLHEKIIDPAYNRFVELVDEGRGMLTRDEVVGLADGSIYIAQEAVNNKLVDQIGYFDDAVAAVMKAAGIKNARVVEYKPVFSLSRMFEAKVSGGLDISEAKVIDWARPRLMYLWLGD